ncbi:hypothetical protein MKW98_025289 [Papaver atlanticum]|uniref:eRF1 domain-containing protein n=1 Tax=Papaver atlanticum TaxID=357466 RepID=A0AAD4X4S9_9MAGN|nr:hypothetical protein MKW98_025289 [Papaver atlanticum]
MSDSQKTDVKKYGFIVMHDKRTLYEKEMIGSMSDLVCAQFACTNYVRKIADLATHFYINQDTMQPNISGLILGGHPCIMSTLTGPNMLSPTLLAKVLCCASTINMCKGILADTKYIQQKYLIQKYFDEYMDDTGSCVFGVVKTLKALESGAVKTLMVCEKLDIRKYIVENSVSGEISIRNFDEEEEEENDQEDDDFYFLTDNEESEVQESQFYINSLATKYNSAVEFVTLKSPEGSQFSFTFKGIGGFLRHQLVKENDDKGGM